MARASAAIASSAACADRRLREPCPRRPCSDPRVGAARARVTCHARQERTRWSPDASTASSSASAPGCLAATERDARARDRHAHLARRSSRGATELGRARASPRRSGPYRAGSSTVVERRRARLDRRGRRRPRAGRRGWRRRRPWTRWPAPRGARTAARSGPGRAPARATRCAEARRAATASSAARARRAARASSGGTTNVAIAPSSQSSGGASRRR